MIYTRAILEGVIMGDLGPVRVDSMLQRLTDRGGQDPSAAAALHPVIQNELRALLAAQHVPRPVASLVREAYVRLVSAEGMRFEDRARFLALASREMRRILVDVGSQQRRLATGTVMPELALDEVVGAGADDCPDILAVDDALESLRALDRRAGWVAELRLFGGLGFPEIEAALGLGRRDVADDWAMARIWLGRALRAAHG